jgi:molecular chaperone DnaK
MNEHGEPVTLANQEGELSTPSVVMFDGNDIIVGTEALRNAVVHPEKVIQNSKRFMGSNHKWNVGGKSYTPVDIAAIILNRLLKAAEEQIGKLEQAIITVPAQFSEIQRQNTVEAGLKAGLKHVDIINEPVAAALCYVLGTEGLWFTELAGEQRIMVYDLGGGTFDLSLVKYEKNEVSVIATSGDLKLGGIDWNKSLELAICNKYMKDFGKDPRDDPRSMQFLAIEVENAKRGLTVRPRAALTCQHAGNRKTFQVDQTQFEKLTEDLTERTAKITKQMLADNNMGWAHVDVILTTGGASRMPMIRRRLKELGGRTLNTSLSPDQSIAHGATYYAGMLLTNSEYAKSILNEEASSRLKKIKQRSVNARALGILVRNPKQKMRFPHYLIKANTPLPTSCTETYGTVVPNQKRVHLHIVESGTAADQQYVELGTCVIDDLPPNLPEGSEIAVTISYDEQSRVHVAARDITSGKQATTEIVRTENVLSVEEPVSDAEDWVAPAIDSSKPTVEPAAETAESGYHYQQPANTEVQFESSISNVLESASQPVPLCNQCGEPLDPRGNCLACGSKKKQTSAAASVRAKKKPAQRRPVGSGPKSTAERVVQETVRSTKTVPPPMDDDEILDLLSDDKTAKAVPQKQKARAAKKPVRKKKPTVNAPPLPPSLQEPSPSNVKEGEDEFWQLVD